MSTIGEKLRRAREAAGLTQEQLAERLGIRQPVISYYEVSRGWDEPDTLRRWAEACGVTLCDLLDGE